MTKVVIQNFKIGQGLLHCWRWNHCTNRLSQPMSRLIWVEGKRIICSVRASHLEGLPFRERVESVRTFNVFFNGKHLTWLYLSQMRKPWRTRFFGYFLGTIIEATCILGPSSICINKIPISVTRSRFWPQFKTLCFTRLLIHWFPTKHFKIFLYLRLY